MKLIPTQMHVQFESNHIGGRRIPRIRMEVEATPEHDENYDNILFHSLELDQYTYPQKAIVKCTYCCGWTARMSMCCHCGAVVD